MSDAADVPDADELVVLGEVMGTHGSAGDLRVKLHNPDSDMLESLGSVQLVQAGEVSARRILSCRRHGKGLLMRLADVTGRDAARALYGAELAVPRSALPALDPDEFYVVDLVGARAVLADGSPVGDVIGYQPYPSVDVILIAAPAGTLELPLIRPYLVDADVKQGRVVVAHVEDLEPTR